MTMKFLAVPLLLISTVQDASASLKINEVAYKGSPNTCNGEDWIELVSSTTQDLFNYTLHDDKGKNDDKAKVFSESIIINPGEYLVLCRNVDFDFGIGSDDVVTLLDTNGDIISEVMLLGSSEADQTFASFEGGYEYTAVPTPGEENVYEKPKPLEVKLAEQNEAGNDFFLEGGDEDGVIFEKVVDLYVTLGNESLATIGKLTLDLGCVLSMLSSLNSTHKSFLFFSTMLLLSRSSNMGGIRTIYRRGRFQPIRYHLHCLIRWNGQDPYQRTKHPITDCLLWSSKCSFPNRI